MLGAEGMGVGWCDGVWVRGYKVILVDVVCGRRAEVEERGEGDGCAGSECAGECGGRRSGVRGRLAELEDLG